jgi:hypothetical protein
MKTTRGIRFATAVAVVLMLTVFSGCIKRTSDPLVEEKDFWPVTEKISVSNSIGSVSITGNGARLFNPQVRVEKSVQTFSLLGLANPAKYVDSVEVYQGVNNGTLTVSVSVKPLPFMERLFVKVSPKVDFALETPVALDTDVNVDIGNVALQNLVGNINAKLDIGELSVNSSLGVFGSQVFDVNIGSLNILLPADMPVFYDSKTDIGSIESTGFNAEVERWLLGARTTGVSGTTVMPSSVKGRVNIGNISFKGE